MSSKPCTPPDGTISDEEISAVDESLLDPSTTGFWSKWRALKSSSKPRLNTQGRIYKNCMVIASRGPFNGSDPPPGTFWNWDLFSLGWGDDKHYYQISCKIDFLSSELPVPSWIRQAEIKSMQKARSSLAPENLDLNSPMPYNEQYSNDIANAVYENISSFFILVEKDAQPKPGDLIDVEISDEVVSLIRISQKGPSLSTDSTETFASTLSNFFGGSSSKMLGEVATEDSRKLTQEQKLESLNPNFTDKVRQVLEELTTEGWQPEIFYAWRSTKEQRDIKQRGHSSLSFSFHNAKKDGKKNSFAADIIDKRYAWELPGEREGTANPTKVVEANIERAKFFNSLGKISKELELFWGGDFSPPDSAHIQLLENSKLASVKKESENGD